MNSDYPPIRFMVKGYECFIDEVDVDLLELRWTVSARKTSDVVYLARSTPQSTVQMQRVIMARILGRSLLFSEKVDHRNRNGLDNTRGNLRLATHSQNLANSITNRNNLLGIKGVKQQGNKFLARIKGKYIGLFDTPELAHAAYMEAARHFFGEFANDGTLDTPPARTENGAQR